ncbi:hypothetical protein DB459_15470 [Bradyrhizobium sp. WD16]|nr:hypothetical protein DB459_15470 [Bradyrhizobium sp. WD16]
MAGLGGSGCGLSQVFPDLLFPDFRFAPCGALVFFTAASLVAGIASASIIDWFVPGSLGAPADWADELAPETSAVAMIKRLATKSNDRFALAVEPGVLLIMEAS